MRVFCKTRTGGNEQQGAYSFTEIELRLMTKMLIR